MGPHNTTAIAIAADASVNEIVHQSHLMMISLTELVNSLIEATSEIKHPGPQKLAFGALYMAEVIEKMLGEASERLEHEEMEEATRRRTLAAQGATS